MWLKDRFGTLPPNSNEATAERFAKVWLWNFLGSFLFPDASGNNISWMFVDILNQPWENIAGYSWGSAVLAWTYRQLCEACRRTSTAGYLGGCAYLLQVWIWERWPIGRPGGLDMAIRDAMPVSISILFISIMCTYYLRLILTPFHLLFVLSTAGLVRARLSPLRYFRLVRDSPSYRKGGSQVQGVHKRS